jgi:hypothetical protein
LKSVDVLDIIIVDVFIELHTEFFSGNKNFLCFQNAFKSKSSYYEEKIKNHLNKILSSDKYFYFVLVTNVYLELKIN